MIKVRGRICTFTGKDAKEMRIAAKKLGLSPQQWFTGMLWEAIMREARKGVFLGKKEMDQ